MVYIIIDIIIGGFEMLMTNFLKNRKSIREFRNKGINTDILDDIRLYLDQLEKEESNGSIKFKLYEYGEKLYKSLKGIGGYSGVMIESPHYIGLEIMNNQEKNIIYSAYYMEKLITKLNNLGIDTCWVSIKDVDEDTKVEVFGDAIGEFNYLLAIGYGKPKNPFINEPFSERIGVDELVYNNEIGNPINMEDLENRGLGDLFYYVRFAPSVLNKQPWRFILKKDKVVLLLKYNKEEVPNLMDAGIIMYYFESLSESVGLNEKWVLMDKTAKLEDCSYKYIAEIKL